MTREAFQEEDSIAIEQGSTPWRRSALEELLERSFFGKRRAREVSGRAGSMARDEV